MAGGGDGAGVRAGVVGEAGAAAAGDGVGTGSGFGAFAVVLTPADFAPGFALVAGFLAGDLALVADAAFGAVAGLAAGALAALDAAFVFGVVAAAAPAVFATGFDAFGLAAGFGLVAAFGAALVAADFAPAEADFGAAFGLAVVFFGVVAIFIPLSGGHHFKRITDRFVAVIAPA